MGNGRAGRLGSTEKAYLSGKAGEIDVRMDFLMLVGLAICLLALGMLGDYLGW